MKANFATYSNWQFTAYKIKQLLYAILVKHMWTYFQIKLLHVEEFLPFIPYIKGVTEPQDQNNFITQTDRLTNISLLEWKNSQTRQFDIKTSNIFIWQAAKLTKHFNNLYTVSHLCGKKIQQNIQVLKYEVTQQICYQWLPE